jgi:hypothetical protein
MSDVKYNERIWLNEDDSHYTGSIVLFDGESIINQGKLIDRYSFVEISSCHGKVRIHNDYNHPLGVYIKKIATLEDELRKYREYLEQQEQKIT